METDHPLSVLLVEDHPAVARQLQELLRDHPAFQVTRVETLAAALAHLQAAAVNLVLLDLGLPDSQGLETLARVVQEHPALPVVVLTAHDESLAAAALHAGAQDYLSKDAIDSATLGRALRYALERKRAEEALRTRTAQLDTARIVSQEIVREMDLARLLRLIGTRAAELLHAPHAGLFLWDPDTECLVPEVWIGDERLPADVPVRLGDGLTGLVARDRRGRIVNAYRQWAGAHPGLLLSIRTEAAVAEPLLYRETLLGVLTVADSTAGRTFTDADAALLRLLADQAAIAIENARLYTATQQALTDLRQAQDELVRTETLRALGQMAAGIAHDLNNKLMVILGQVELLRLGVAHPTHEAALASLEAATQQTAAVIRKILDFARQGARVPTTPLALGPVVQAALALTAPQRKEAADQRGEPIALQTALADCPPILGNPAEVQEALTHVLLNAIEAMPTGGTLTVAGALAEPGWVDLAVSDTGVGMPPEIQAKALEPFFTTKGVQRAGLGLAAVFGILQRHGGAVTLASTVGQGTTVTLRFRAAPHAAA